ncbi:hypothetical protein EDD22DRAFT_852395 [Suillus occidentalis]|nr:hypothetical protein EDD22DRAFT_852395 [Suillus occidentalis]
MQWVPGNTLLGFTQLNNAHNGQHLGGALFKVLDRVGVTHKEFSKLYEVKYHKDFLWRQCKINKAPHYNPHNPHAHEPDLAQRVNHDEIGLVCSICVKEHSSVKWKELYRTVQTKAGVSLPTQLLIDMKVHWSLTYIMLNYANCNKQHVDTFVYEMGRQEQNLSKRAKIDFLQLMSAEWTRVGQFMDLLSYADMCYNELNQSLALLQPATTKSKVGGLKRLIREVQSDSKDDSKAEPGAMSIGDPSKPWRAEFTSYIKTIEAAPSAGMTTIQWWGVSSVGFAGKGLLVHHGSICIEREPGPSSLTEEVGEDSKHETDGLEVEPADDEPGWDTLILEEEDSESDVDSADDDEVLWNRLSKTSFAKDGSLLNHRQETHPSATAPPPLTLSNSESDYRGNWPLSVLSNSHPAVMPQMCAPPRPSLNNYHGNWHPSVPSNPYPSTMPQMWASSSLNNYDGSLPLPPFMVPSQDLRPSDLALILPPAIMDYWHKFPPPVRQKIFKPTLPCLDLPPLKYQHNLSKHEDFILAAETQLISHAVNICVMIESSDREVVVQAELAHAVKKCLEKAHDIGPNSTETMKKKFKLSMPFKLIMAASKESAFTVVERGYDLCPSIWLEILESELKQSKIKHLIYNAMCLLKFIFKKGDNTGQWMVFEHDALLDMVIGIVRKLKYQDYVKDLDNLYCTTMAALYCVLKQFSHRKMHLEIDFTAHAFKFMYDLSKAHIRDVIEQDEILAKQWSELKEYTIHRLVDILQVVVAESWSS